MAVIIKRTIIGFKPLYINLGDNFAIANIAANSKTTNMYPLKLSIINKLMMNTRDRIIFILGSNL